ncbi:MAG: hypothetical protein JWP48_5421 [Actinoallomurus sp.]|jgi:hypothetical protein|nr:hypothetical protein [Actinoallomurus sp.]
MVLASVKGPPRVARQATSVGDAGLPSLQFKVAYS